MPYQLHCWPPVATELLLTATDEELLTLLTGVDEELTTLLTGAEDELLTLLICVDEDAEDGVPPPQILPVTVGRSALPPRLSTWKPNSTVWPG